MKQAVLKTATAAKRLVFVLVAGLLTGLGVAAAGQASLAPLVAWDTVAVLYAGSVLLTVLRFNGQETRTHALRENPGRAVADILLTIASIASLVAVGFLIFQAGRTTGIEKAVDISLGLCSVIISWAAVHTLYMLRYARLYYGNPEGGIGFNSQAAPQYSDFAYMAFTIGMTFQVSDTNLQTKELRATVLKQALLSYLFGTVIIATTINTLVSLSK